MVLAVIRTIHDRYAPAKRNPYNEVEFSDFYARAMASYGSFIAACGFEYNGPAGTIGFDPVMQPENFRAPFTAAEGWGTFSQTIADSKMTAELGVNWGSVKLKSIKLNPQGQQIIAAKVTLDGTPVAAKLLLHQSGITINLNESVSIAAGQTLKVATGN